LFSKTGKKCRLLDLNPSPTETISAKFHFFFLFWEIFRGTLRAAFALLGGERDTFLMDLSGSSDLGDPLAFDDLHAPFQDVAFFESEEHSDAFGNPFECAPKKDQASQESKQ